MRRCLALLVACWLSGLVLPSPRRRGRHQGSDDAARHQGLAGRGQERPGRNLVLLLRRRISASEPDSQKGVTSLLALLLTDGAGSLAGQAFKRREEDAEVSLGFGASLDRLSGSLRVLSANRDEGFELLRLAMTEPRFDPDMVDQRRAQAIAGVNQADAAARHGARRTL